MTRRRDAGPILSALVVAVASWPGTLQPGASIDIGWVVGLHMAASQQLEAGREWVYSYGPLGFLSGPAWLGITTGRASVLVVFAVRAALAFVLINLLRPRLRTSVAVVATFVFMALVQWEAAELALLGLSAVAVHSLVTRRELSPGALVAVGALGGVLAAVKLNTAIAAGGIGVILALSGRRRGRDLAVLGATAATTFGALWVALGQPIGTLVAYGRGAAEVVDGYTAAMALEAPATAWHYPAALALIVLVASAMRGATRPRRPLVVLLLWIGFVEAKHGFVRHDAHALAFFSAVAVVGAALSHRTAGLAAAVAGTVVVGFIVPAPKAIYLPVNSARGAVRDLASVVRNPAARVEGMRRDLAAAYGDGAVLAARAKGTGLHVDPDDAAIAFASGQRWDPLPNFQAFVAYTAALDDQNARAIRRGGPANVLVDLAPPDYDGRFRLFDAPATRLGLLCHYEQRAALGQWALLAPAPPRCGTERRLAMVRARAGESVTVAPPTAPDRIVVGRIHAADPSVGERLRAVLAKPARNPSIVVNGARHRFVRAWAGQPLLLRVPGGAPFGPGVTGVPAVESLALEDLGDVTIEFSELAYS